MPPPSCLWACQGPWEQQLAAYRAFLRQAAHHVLLTHSAARIISSAVPSQRTFVAEVQLLQPVAGSPVVGPAATLTEGGRRFLFELGLQASGWGIEAIRAL